MLWVESRSWPGQSLPCAYHRTPPPPLPRSQSPDITRGGHSVSRISSPPPAPSPSECTPKKPESFRGGVRFSKGRGAGWPAPLPSAGPPPPCLVPPSPCLVPASSARADAGGGLGWGLKWLSLTRPQTSDDCLSASL